MAYFQSVPLLLAHLFANLQPYNADRELTLMQRFAEKQSIANRTQDSVDVRP